MGATLVHAPCGPAVGSKISAVFDSRPALDKSPPRTKTLPSGNISELKVQRATFIDASADHVPVA